MVEFAEFVLRWWLLTIILFCLIGLAYEVLVGRQTR